MSAATPLLEIDNLVVEIQSMPALRGFSMRVARGAMVSLVGRNGAGKTTLMRSIMGHLKLAQGVVRFEGADLSSSPRHARASLGIGYMPEDRCLVPQLTVEENIMLPLWVSGHLDRKARLDFVYEVIGELTEMRAAQGAVVKRRAAEAGRARPSACHRHQMPAARRALRRHCAGSVRAAVGGACIAPGQGSHLADVAVGHESFARAD